jgi:hypothetical protein
MLESELYCPECAYSEGNVILYLSSDRSKEISIISISSTNASNNEFDNALNTSALENNLIDG